MEVELGAAGIGLPRKQAGLVPQLAGLADGVQRRRQGDPRLLAGALQCARFLRPLQERTPTPLASTFGWLHSKAAVQQGAQSVPRCAAVQIMVSSKGSTVPLYGVAHGSREPRKSITLFSRNAACLRLEEPLNPGSIVRLAMPGGGSPHAERSAGQQYSRTFGPISRGGGVPADGAPTLDP